MHRRAMLLIIGSLLLTPGCGSDPTGPVLQPSELCSDHGNSAIATFEDPDLERAVRTTLGIGPLDDLTCGLLKTLTSLEGGGRKIENLMGTQNLTSLTGLTLAGNPITDLSPLSGLGSLTGLNLFNSSITDIGALAGLTGLVSLNLPYNSITDVSAVSQLTSLLVLNLNGNSVTDINSLSGLTSLLYLQLNSNSITDISALEGLTNLTTIDLGNNSTLTDIQPLLDNTGLGFGVNVDLRSTSVSCADVVALAAKIGGVQSDCP